MRTLVIAEAGVNHNGDLDLAKRLIDVAVEAGADIVKFQTFSAARLATRQAPKAGYQVSRADDGESQQALLRRLELSETQHVILSDHCARAGIEFLSTGFDENSVDMLVELGTKRFKIPSGEITNLPYLRHVGRYGRPVILSTGMSDLHEVASALEVLEGAGTPRSRITVLHCNTAYPTPFEDVNLAAMSSMREDLHVAVGYSDHTLGFEVSIAAVALGATIIEKHFTVDRSLPGPDHAASLEPHELGAMVKAIRNTQVALGDGVKRAMPSEIPNMVAARKSIVAARPIRTGELLTEENLAVRRPGGGLSPMRWDEVLGRKAARDFAAEEAIEL